VLAARPAPNESNCQHLSLGRHGEHGTPQRIVRVSLDIRHRHTAQPASCMARTLGVRLVLPIDNPKVDDVTDAQLRGTERRVDGGWARRSMVSIVTSAKHTAEQSAVPEFMCGNASVVRDHGARVVVHGWRYDHLTGANQPEHPVLLDLYEAASYAAYPGST